MSKYFRSYFPYKNRVGKIYDEVLVTEYSANSKADFVGHNKQYDHIIILGRGRGKNKKMFWLLLCVFKVLGTVRP